jgi:hypothetical protein
MTLDTELRELDVPAHRPGFFDELREELGRDTTRRARLRPRLLLIAATAAIAVGALVFGLTRGSEVASAAQVRAAVERAFASTGSISGVFVDNESVDPDAAGVRWQFTANSDGSFRIDGLTSDSERAYDAATNVESTSDGSVFVRHTGLAPGPPDAAPVDFAVESDLGSAVAALAAARNPVVEEITYDGRPAWRLADEIGSEGRVAIVDRGTGVPVRVELLTDGKLTSGWRIEGLRVSPTVTAIPPLEPRPGQDTQTDDAGFRDVSLDEARSLAEYTPLVPPYLPAGFTLSTIAYAASVPAMRANPPSRDVISLAYRRGLDEIVVTTRRTGSSAADWHDPVTVSFVAGVGEDWPHFWYAGPKLVVTVAGTVDNAELSKVTKSLQASEG